MMRWCGGPGPRCGCPLRGSRGTCRGGGALCDRRSCTSGGVWDWAKVAVRWRWVAEFVGPYGGRSKIAPRRLGSVVFLVWDFIVKLESGECFRLTGW